MPRRAAVSAALLMLVEGCARPACSPCAPGRAEPGAEAVRAAVRGAVGYERMRALTAGFEVVETDTAGGDTVVWRFGPSGELLRAARGAPVPDLGFDGRYAWQVTSRNPGVADPLSLRNREKLLTPPWVRGGWWLHPRAPFRFALVDSLSDASRVALSLRAPDGVVGSTVFVDRRTSLPAALVVEYERGPYRVVYEDYREALGFRIPFRTTTTYAGNTSVRRIAEVRAVAGPAAEAFAVPPIPANHAFDPAQPAAVAVARAAPYADGSPGHVFVRPRVDGREVRWWNFDSGAEAMTIDAALADSLSLPVVGRTAMIGSDGRRREVTIRRARTFTLGRLTLRDPLLLAEDLSANTSPPGTRRGGAVGYPVFRHAVIEFARGGDSVSLHDPAAYVLPPGARWAELSFIDMTPAACATIEGGRRGLYQLDTGHANAMTLYGPYVARENLLAGRETRTVTSSGTGGAYQTTLGRLAWIDLGGKRWENVEVELRTGGASREGGAGVIGRELLRAFTAVFDYPRRRVALVPTDERGARSLEGCRWPSPLPGASR